MKQTQQSQSSLLATVKTEKNHEQRCGKRDDGMHGSGKCHPGDGRKPMAMDNTGDGKQGSGFSPSTRGEKSLAVREDTERTVSRR